MIMFFQRSDHKRNKEYSYMFTKPSQGWNPKSLKLHNQVLTVIIFEDGKLKEILWNYSIKNLVVIMNTQNITFHQ